MEGMCLLMMGYGTEKRVVKYEARVQTGDLTKDHDAQHSKLIT